MTEPFDPMQGVRLRPACVRLLDYLADGEWHSRRALAEVMLDSSDLAPKTVDNLISWYRRTDAIVLVGRGNDARVRIGAGPAAA